MANKRMFSKEMIQMDAFLEMSHSAQMLYVYMCLEADDDGFVDTTRGIMRSHDFQKAHLDELLERRFILQPGNNVYVVKHWRLHNNVPKDRYKPTKYVEEKKTLQTKDNGVYTEKRIQNVDEPVHEIRLDKIRLDKNTSAKADKKTSKIKKKENQFTTLGADVLKAFETVDPKNKTYYANKTQRAACDFLINEYSFEKVIDVITVLPQLNKEKLYIAQITSPWELQQNWVKLMNVIHQKKVDIKKGKDSVAFA